MALCRHFRWQAAGTIPGSAAGWFRMYLAQVPAPDGLPEDLIQPAGTAVVAWEMYPAASVVMAEYQDTGAGEQDLCGGF